MSRNYFQIVSRLTTLGYSTFLKYTTQGRLSAASIPFIFKSNVISSRTDLKDQSKDKTNEFIYLFNKMKISFVTYAQFRIIFRTIQSTWNELFQKITTPLQFKSRLKIIGQPSSRP